MSSIALHPLIDGGLPEAKANFSGGDLVCKCSSNQVTVHLDADVVHNHACGCSKCWKPNDALFSIVGVVPSDKLKVTSGEDKLQIVDSSAVIQRHACKDCGVHLYGRIVKDHPFKGLDFVHVELGKDKGWQPPQFAAFVSSIIEAGFDASKIDEVRKQFKQLGLESYDCLSPPLMDAIADWTYKQKHGGQK